MESSNIKGREVAMNRREEEESKKKLRFREQKKKKKKEVGKKEEGREDIVEIEVCISRPSFMFLLTFTLFETL